MNVNLASRLLICQLITVSLFAQAKDPDVLILADGEKLIGHFLRAGESTLVFVSQIAGQVTIPWAKVQELRVEGKFAAIPKNVVLRNSDDAATVAQGSLAMSGAQLQVKSDATQRTLPIAEVGEVVPQASFDHAFHRQRILEGWNGFAGLGLGLTRATTDTRALSASINIARVDPSEEWLRARNKTLLDFNFVSTKTSSFGETDTDVTLFQANAVREFYVTPRKFLFAGANLEHNSAQGLDLMQGYGGGFGAVLFKSEHGQLSARAGLGYVHQGFTDSTLNRNIIGSRFNQTFTYTFPRGITFTETGGFRPAWNHSNAYVAGFIASLSVPMYHRLNVSLNSFDSYLNNPPPYFKKNTLQITLGVNYVIK